jgi:hypothetical protein
LTSFRQCHQSHASHATSTSATQIDALHLATVEYRKRSLHARPPGHPVESVTATARIVKKKGRFVGDMEDCVVSRSQMRWDRFFHAAPRELRDSTHALVLG